MISTFLLYAAGGYFGTPSSFQFTDWGLDGWGGNPGPTDAPLKVFPFKKPKPRPWWKTGVAVVGGVLGGFAVNMSFAENPVLALGGAVIGGRLAFDAVNAITG